MDSQSTVAALLFGWIIMAFWPWIGALIGITAAKARGYDALFGLVAGLVLGPFVVLIYATHIGVQCPYCGEWVRHTASICKHCHSTITPARKAWTGTAKRPDRLIEQRVKTPDVFASTQDGDVWRCGRPGCGRQMTRSVGACPHCGAVHI